MSNLRQSAALIRSLHTRYAPGVELEPHTHAWAQLVYATEGVMTVRTSGGAWVVPPERALLVPPEVEHAIRMAGRVTMRTLYLSPALVGARFAARANVIHVSSLLREVVLHIVRRGTLRDDAPADVRLAEVLVDLMETVPVAALELRMPSDARARRAAERLRGGADVQVPIAELARQVGASRRTLERCFERETGMTLGRWRQQARLLRALELLASGEPVTRVALEVGYQSPSAFIQTFRVAFGTTPGRYYESARTDPARTLARPDDSLPSTLST